MDSSQALQPAPPRLKAPWSYKWTAFSIVSLGTLLSTLDGSIVNIAYPVLSETFGTDASIVAWVGIAFFLTSTSLLLTMGWIGDFLGRERLYILGLLLFAVALALAPLAQNIAQLILVRALQGIGAAMVVSVGSAILAATFEAKERGLAFGLLGATVGFGTGRWAATWRRGHRSSGLAGGILHATSHKPGCGALELAVPGTAAADAGRFAPGYPGVGDPPGPAERLSSGGESGG